MMKNMSPELSRNFTKQQLDKSTSAKFIMEDMSPKLSHNFTKLLVRSRLEMEHEFSAGKRKKSVLWAKVVNKMSMVNADVPKSKDLMQRKFLNLFATYKRIKRRNEQTGREATSWEFFEEFDDVYGRRHSIQPPAKNLQGSLMDSAEVCEGSGDDNTDYSSESQLVNERRKRPKTAANEALEFLKNEALKEQTRHEEVLQFEKEKLNFEKEKINVMMKLRETLEKLTEK
ncbi:uncharacterized protein LOC126765339 [Bactrocera neohumeralis]|uniref:uncharacterized protein LOC126764557 n=1 Tax=Bactrocera neohumeralis TaxID=98809 RepID=UPI0021663557|nr:uncharacterized protein LOC126764557 [Bactrocera neohumeralis]XP_050339019.1 uncharacterized protein LOC126765339 [Bactrocera neohumeralis]